MRSKEALTNDILNEVSYLISDFGAIRGLPQESTERKGFSAFSKLFCDSIIFWGLYNGAKEETRGSTIGKYIAELRDTFTQNSLDVESVKLASGNGSGILDARNNHRYFSKAIHERFRRECGDQVCQPKYVAIKVSLDYCRAKRVVPMLANALPLLADKCIVLHDIDFAYDCRYITTRGILAKYIVEKKAGRIVDDRHKVGMHCISWWGKKQDTKNIRHKVYNKFIQALESADVRKSLGSRMENLVENEGTFAHRLERHKNHGYTRIELTFYNPELQSLSQYFEHMEKTRELLNGCRTFSCSFENQWKQRAESITSMVAVHFPEKNWFAYCHWWNSITSKKYGYLWTTVTVDIMPKLLANFSFNDRPIYLITAGIGENGKGIVEKETIYERVPGCTAITLVAGGHKGMFPSRVSEISTAREFSEVGIVEVNNITIGWPRGRHNKGSAPLADIVEKTTVDVDDNGVKELKIIHTSTFRAGYNVLNPDQEYTIVAAGMKEYRSGFHWHAITNCGVKLKMGNSLSEVWDRWRRRCLRAGTRRWNVDGVERMTFIATRKVRIHGYDDMRCELVE
jgi:hypothetical protein